MHVIITQLSKNIRVQNQAFGRTARKGKKGTGIIIFYNRYFNSYEEIKNDRNKREVEKLNRNLKYVNLILLRDKLFENFSNFIKKSQIDYKSYLYKDITERWGYFLIEKVSIYNEDNFDANKIEEDYKKFENELTDILNQKNLYDKFFNPFWRTLEGLKGVLNNEKKCINFFNFDEEDDYFYLSSSYYKPIALIIDNKGFMTKGNCDKILEYLNKTKEKIKKLNDNFFNPILEINKERESILNSLRLNLDFKESNIFFDYLFLLLLINVFKLKTILMIHKKIMILKILNYIIKF